jgi:hypothetical protein
MFNCIQLGPTTCKCVVLFDRNVMCTKLGGFYNECSLACLLMPQFFQYPKLTWFVAMFNCLRSCLWMAT